MTSPAPCPHDVSSTSTADPGTPAHATADGAGRDVGGEYARETVRARLRRELADLDYVRALHRWAATGTSQRDIARQLRMSQPAVSKHLARSAEATQPLPGFDGATPVELCKRYAAGWLTREDLIAQLVAFPWTPMPHLIGWEDPLVLPEGTWQDLSHAQGKQYIDRGIYAEVFARHQAQQQAQPLGQEQAQPSGEQQAQPPGEQQAQDARPLPAAHTSDESAADPAAVSTDARLSSDADGAKRP